MVIRPYTSSDFPVISSWWQKANEFGPLETMLPLDSTFILELHGIPALCVSLYLTNITEFCYVENFAGNPDLKGSERRQAAAVLSSYIETFAASLGYKRLVCLAYKEPLKKRYQELGYPMTLDGVATFCKVIA